MFSHFFSILDQGEPEAAVAVSKNLICKFFLKSARNQSRVFQSQRFSSFEIAGKINNFDPDHALGCRGKKKKACLVKCIQGGQIKFEARNVLWSWKVYLP